jgi:hypothetical protein
MGSPYTGKMIATVNDAIATAVRNKNIRNATQSHGKRRAEDRGARRFITGVVKFPMNRT